MKKTGDEYFDSDEFRELLTTYEEAVGTGQPVFLDADELSEIADYYQMNGRAEEASEAIDMALSLSPGSIMPLTYKIHEALYNHKVDEAEDYLSQIIDTSDPDYLYDKVEIMLAKGQADAADKMLQELLEELPEEEKQDFIVDIANIFQENNHNQKALAWIERAHAEDTADFKELRGRILFDMGNHEEGTRLFNELIDQDPFCKRYWSTLASMHFIKEEYDDAIQSSEYALAIDPQDAEGLIIKANALFKLENFEKAAEFYKRYEEVIPNDDFALLHYGTCLCNLGRTDEGIDKLRHAASLVKSAPYTEKAQSPYINDIYEELAFRLLDSGLADEALACLDQTDTLSCDHVLMTTVKGHVLLASNRTVEAEEMYRQAIAMSENPADAFLRVAVSIYDNHYVKAAYRMLETYFRISSPDNNDGYAYMALCCYDLKRQKEFLKYLKEACRRNPQECKLVLGHLFPDELSPEDYFDYIVGNS